ncbi:TPA: Ail/Lom family outer membrane beta-barrel protein [Salmonella enterica subsp. enterica serovar Ball]|nr:outer membrane beta-barrel protein [Salmonella enterica subsp. enterica serovar Ball]
MNKLAVAVLVMSVIGGVGAANAADYKNTVSLGYALTHMSGPVSGNAGGVNLKYNWEHLNSGFGVMGSVTYTSADVDYYGYRLGDVNYTSFLVGPSYRFNDYISTYVMLGGARGELEDNFGHSDSKTSFAYGLGVQVNPVENFAINASYEHSKFSTQLGGDIDTGTWVLGVGYSF